MNKNALPVFAIALILAATAWFVFGAEDAPLDTGFSDAEIVEENAGAELVAKDASAEKSTDTDAPTRAEIAGGDDGEDPRWSQAMAAFRGRLVFTSGKPAPNKIVRFVRADAELVQNPYVFAENPTKLPKLETYESESAADGTFTVRGAWPQAFFLFVADVNGENQRTRLLDRSPGPGEVIDLGDIELPDLGTISGTVQNMDGEPAADALVRAVDLPAAFLDLAPVHFLDPEGGVMVDERGFRTIITMPPLARRVFDMLPIPMTRTADDGTFLLKGVQPGSNVVLVNLKAHLPFLKKGVRVKAGKEKKIGRVGLKEGEIAEGTVTDTNDDPVTGAEVLLANKNAMIPMHFASFANRTDEKGRFSMSGLRPGPVYAAVRRSADEAWTVVGPVSVSADLEVKLPAFAALTLRVKTLGGKAPVDVKFKVAAVPGENGPGLDLASLGLAKWIDVSKRVARLEDGRYQITDLMPSDYSIAVQAAGHAASRVNISVKSDVEHEVVLQPAVVLPISVVDAEGDPVRSAKVYAMIRGASRRESVQQIPVLSGRTDLDGKHLVENCRPGKARLTVSHPAYGKYHKDVTIPAAAPVVFTVQEAGAIKGLLLDGGKPAKPGKWTILVQRSWRENNGAMPFMPRFAVADLEGKFRVAGLAPGKYRIECIPAIGGIGSPGGIAMLVSSPRQYTNNRVETEVPSAGEVFVKLDPSGKREVTGPSAAVSGTVMLNGRPATGMVVNGWSPSGQIYAEVDASGRFDIGRVGVGRFDIRLRKTPGANMSLADMSGGELWRHNGQIKENEDQRFDLTLNTGSIAGVVLKNDGTPAASVEIEASGQVLAQLDNPKKRSAARVETLTDASGRFEFKQVVAGEYRLSVRGRRGHVQSKPIVVQGGLPVTDVRLKLEKVFFVDGKVDLSVYSDKSDRSYFYIRFSGKDGRGTRIDNKTGAFRLEGLPNGTYQVQIHRWGDGNNQNSNGYAAPVVIERDMEGVKITPMFRPPKQVKPRKR